MEGLLTPSPQAASDSKTEKDTDRGREEHVLSVPCVALQRPEDLRRRRGDRDAPEPSLAVSLAPLVSDVPGLAPAQQRGVSPPPLGPAALFLKSRRHSAFGKTGLKVESGGMVASQQEVNSPLSSLI